MQVVNSPAAAEAAPQADTRRAGRLDSLDALRGVAIVLVVIGHYLPGRVIAGGLAEAAIRPFALGGVTLFFLLSGFLIERNLQRDRGIADYALKRLWRILPAYWVSLAVLVAVDRLLVGTPGYGTPRQVVANALLVPDIAGVALLSGVFWTLLVESKFYLIAPIVSRAGRLATLSAPMLVIAVNAMIFLKRGEASNLLTYLACCLVGMNFSLWSRGELSGVALALLCSALAISLGIFSPYYKIGLCVLGFAGAIALAAALARPARFALLGWLGAVSYSWYLYHAGIGYPLMAWLEGRGGWSAYASTAAGVAVTLAMAWLSFRWIELPGIAIGHRTSGAATRPKA